MLLIQRNIRIGLLAALVISAGIIWYAVFYFEQHQNLIVHFFDVGQGDSILIESPNGNQILIDGGPSNAILAKLGRTLPFWDHSIDLFILTHPHSDHVTGLLEVLRRYDVGAVVETGVEYSTPEYKEWQALLGKKQVPVFFVHAGEKIQFAQNGYFDLLLPTKNFVGASLKNVHDSMIVSKMHYGSTTILFTGDAEKTLEAQLVGSGANLLSDILKIGHHGSKTSSTENFLRAVQPKVAVIQVGRKNRFGHPTQEVLDRLTSHGIQFFRNDLDGDIEFESDGSHFRKN